MRRVLHIIDSLDRTDAAQQLHMLARGLAREGVGVHIAALDAIKDPPALKEEQGEGSECGPLAIPITPDIVMFEIPDEFVVGYGLDYEDRFRNLPYVAALEPEDLSPA